MSNPRYVKVDDVQYKINTDFRVAIECNRIALDTTIGDIERTLAIIYKLFGEQGLECENRSRLIELAFKYISLGREQKGLKNDSRKDYELDFNKCEGLIRSSFKFDYGFDPYELEYMHWYDFYNDLENLSSNEFGTCCILNRVLNVLNYDTKEVKDSKEKKKIIDAQEELKKEYCNIKGKKMTKEQEESAKGFYKSLGIQI